MTREYHQTNLYRWANGERRFAGFPSGDSPTIDCTFATEIDGWAAAVDLDEHQRTMMLHWTRVGEAGSCTLYEMIQISDDNETRARVWHWFKKDRLQKRTLVDERCVFRRIGRRTKISIQSISRYSGLTAFDSCCAVS